MRRISLSARMQKANEASVSIVLYPSMKPVPKAEALYLPRGAGRLVEV